MIWEGKVCGCSGLGKVCGLGAVGERGWVKYVGAVWV